MENNPIGIFDSGVGGLSVLREIKKRLPCESIIYFADSSNCPYGSKSEKETIHLARKNIEFLLDQGCKMIVIACNTVTAVAIERFRKEFHVPFIGMEPALKPAALKTKTKKIGILATENTFKGKLFQQTCKKYGKGIDVIAQPGNGLVELVEDGDLESPETYDLLEKYLSPMMEMGVDILVLGCTHYPFLIRVIEKITHNRLDIIDPASAVAAQTLRILDSHSLTSKASHIPNFRFCTTLKTQAIETLLNQTLDGGPYGVELVEV